jgi:hypothetical protein
MSDYEKALAGLAMAARIRGAVFGVLRDAGGPLSCKEIVELMPDDLGHVSAYAPGAHLVLMYGDVFAALRQLEKVGAVTSQKVYNSRIWWARG